ncbi:MAG: PilZ domain-containing protein [Spirochaetota bacterium]
MKDRREQERYQLDLPARVTLMEPGKTQVLQLYTKNVCNGGAFLPTSRKIPLGSRVQLDLILSIGLLHRVMGANGLVRVKGTIIRTEPEGIAVHFDKHYQLASTPEYN